MLHKFFLSLLVLPLLSCSSSQEGAQIPVVNPMPAIWDSTRNEIVRLKEAKATASQWKEKAESSEKVVSKKALAQLTHDVDLTDAERASLLKQHQNSAQTVHYGFEGNFHALVFFNSQGSAQNTLLW